MSERTTRRHAFRRLLQEATRGAQEIVRPLVPDRELRPRARTRRKILGEPARRFVDDEELVARAAGVGLGERLDEVRRLARVSVRATPAAAGERPSGRSKLGGRAALPRTLEWPRWNDVPLRFVGQFDLAAVQSEAIAHSVLHASGLLLLFYAASAPSGLEPEHGGGARAIWLDGGTAPALADHDDRGAVPLRLSTERVLPRRWFSAVRELDLDPGQSEAWDRLRLEIAEAQGVRTHDVVRDFLELHRLLGYADERKGDMRLACELLDRGERLEQGVVLSHPAADSATEASGRWQLLAQFSGGATLPSGWAEDWNRLYFWADEDQLRDGNFSGVRALRR